MTTDATRLRNHFMILAKESGVRVCTTCHSDFAHNSAFCDRSSPSVCIAPINGPISYITAMHELGHLRHPQGNIKEEQSRYKKLMDHLSKASSNTSHLTTWDLNLMIISELSAWDWALRHALVWTPECGRAYRYAMATYLRGFDVLKDHLPVTDPINEKLYQYDSPREAIIALRDELINGIGQLLKAA